MLPVITSFMAAHRLTDVTVVADAGMASATNERLDGWAEPDFDGLCCVDRSRPMLRRDLSPVLLR